MKTIVTLIFILVVTFAGGCYYDKEELLYGGAATDCSRVNARFTQVNAIIANKCAISGCHNSTSSAGGVILETYDQIKTQANRINQRTVIDRTMPPDIPLSSGETGIIKCWISAGSPN